MKEYVLTQEIISKINELSSNQTTPFVIVVNTLIDMNGTPLNLADGTIYRFEDGGCIKNSVVYGAVQIEARGMVQIFDNVTVPDMLNNEVPIEWFGGVCYTWFNSTWASDRVFSSQALADAVVSRRGRKILFQSGYYLFDDPVTIDREGIILSGTMSHNRPGIRELLNSGSQDNGIDSVSTLVFISTGISSFLTTTCNGTRLENLQLHEADATSAKRVSTAVELAGNAVSIYVDRCKFYNWGKGISRTFTGTSTDCGLSRSIISECFFHYIRNTGIEANVRYITYNTIRDSWFSRCGCPIRLVASDELLQDNNIENCNFDFVVYDDGIYPSYGCCAIYMNSGSLNSNYATNDISRCYFEMIGFEKNGGVVTVPPNDTCVNTAAIICLNCAITVANNFFTAVPRYFLIDNNSSVSIGDNGIGINDEEVKYYPLPHNALVEVISGSVSKSLHQSILYNNSIPIPPESDNSFVTKLVNFNSVSKYWFNITNLYETQFTDYGPQKIKGTNSRAVSTLATELTTNILQVDYDSDRYTDFGYFYHSLRMYVSLQYSVYCDVYEVTIDMINLWGNAMLIHDGIRTIYGDTGILPSHDITMKLKRDSEVNGRFYIYVNAPSMNPTFMVTINSDDLRVSDASAFVNQTIFGDATSINVRSHRGAANARPSFNASQNVESKGYEYYDTTNSRKSVWNGSRWLTFKAEPDGAATSGTTNQRPTSLLTSADVGFTYFDTTLGKPVYWKGNGWVNANGTAT